MPNAPITKAFQYPLLPTDRHLLLAASRLTLFWSLGNLLDELVAY